MNCLARKRRWQTETWVVVMLVVGYPSLPAQEATMPPAKPKLSA